MYAGDLKLKLSVSIKWEPSSVCLIRKTSLSFNQQVVANVLFFCPADDQRGNNFGHLTTDLFLIKDQMLKLKTMNVTSYHLVSKYEEEHECGEKSQDDTVVIEVECI